MTITKTFSFDAAHFLPNVPNNHQCKRMHGHTYRVTVEVTGDVDPVLGWVIDFAELSAAWSDINATVDHRLLNDVTGLENPTSEILAPWLLARFREALPLVSGLTLHESSSTTCRVTA